MLETWKSLEIKMSHSDEKPWPLSSTHLKTEYLGIRMIKIRVEGQRTWADPTNSQNHHLQITIVYCITAIETSQTNSQRIAYTVLNLVQKNVIEISVCDIVNTRYNILFCCDCIWPVLRCTTALWWWQIIERESRRWANNCHRTPWFGEEIGKRTKRETPGT